MNKLRLILAVALALAPGLAFAGGGGGIVGAIVGVVGVVLAPFTAGLSLGMTVAAIAGAAAVGYMIGATVEMIINPPSFDMPDASNAQAEQQNTGVTVNKQGTNLAIPVVYGLRKVGGQRVFMGTNGSENKYLYIALVLSEGEINAIKKIWIDDTLVWTGTSVHATQYTANTGGKFQNYFTFVTYHGTNNQTASALLKEASGWGDDKTLTGLAYLACRCEWPKITTNDEAKQNPWQGLPNIVVEMEGKKVYSPAVLTYNYDGLTYAQRRNFSNYFNTYGYSDHPVDCILDYLRNEIYGKGLADTQIDWHSFYRERVRWSKDQNGLALAQDKQHKTNAIVFTDRTVMDNVKTFLLNMRSSLVYQDGCYRLVVVDNGNASSIYGVASTVALTINEDDIIGGIKVEAESGENKFNRVVVSYMGAIDGEGNKTYEPAEYTWPEPDSALEYQYLVQDNNRVVENKITLEHVTDVTTAAKLAQIILDRSRNKGKTISFQGTARLFQLEVGDVVTLDYDSLSINGKFRVKNIVQNADFTFHVTLEEHDDVTYAYNPKPRTVKQYKEFTLGTANPGPGVPTNDVVVFPGTTTAVPATITTGLTPGSSSNLMRVVGYNNTNYTTTPAPVYNATTKKVGFVIQVLTNSAFRDIYSYTTHWRKAGDVNWNWSGTGSFDNNAASGVGGGTGGMVWDPGRYEFRFDFKDATMSQWSSERAFSLYYTYQTPTASTANGVTF